MHPRLTIPALGLTQIIGYGTLYYSFSVLAPTMAQSLAWSREWIFGAFSAALLLGGLAAPFAGRLIDRHGAGRIMAGGSVLSAMSLGGTALAPNAAAFVLGLIAIQVSSTLVQYSAAFALLVQMQPHGAQRRIIHLTLIAGFASTIFWPLTALLHDMLDWRQVYLLFGALNLLVCMPVHAILSRRGHRRAAIEGMQTAQPDTLGGSLPEAARPRAFILMVVGFALESLVNAALLVHMLPLLRQIGLGGAGVMVGTLFGPAQVLSRFTNMVFSGRLSQLVLAIISAVFLPAAIGLLLMTAPSVPGAFGFAVLFGLGSGLASIVQGTLPLALFGSAGYGERIGKVTSVRLIVSSAAPFAFALMMGHLGTMPALAVTAALGSIAILAFVTIGRQVGFFRSKSRRGLETNVVREQTPRDRCLR